MPLRCCKRGRGIGNLGTVAKQHGLQPNSVGLWKRAFLGRGPELPAGADTVREYERFLGQKEPETALVEGLLGQTEKNWLRHPLGWADERPSREAPTISPVLPGRLFTTRLVERVTCTGRKILPLVVRVHSGVLLGGMTL